MTLAHAPEWVYAAGIAVNAFVWVSLLNRPSAVNMVLAWINVAVDALIWAVCMTDAGGWLFHTYFALVIVGWIAVPWIMALMFSDGRLWAWQVRLMRSGWRDLRLIAHPRRCVYCGACRSLSHGLATGFRHVGLMCGRCGHRLDLH